MGKKKIIQEVKKIAKKNLKGESSGHDYSHIERVYKLALKIGKKEKADLFVLFLAGLLYDIDVRRGRTNHHLRSAKVAGKILEKLGVNKKTIIRVQEAIRAHSYRGAKENPAKTLEAKIISDADKLDVMGAIGIGRIFIFNAHFGRPMHNPKLKPDPKRYSQKGAGSAINAFYEKIFLLPKVLHTKTAKKIGQQRIEFTKNFVKQFLEEWQGKI